MVGIFILSTCAMGCVGQKKDKKKPQSFAVYRMFWLRKAPRKRVVTPVPRKLQSRIQRVPLRPKANR